MINQFESQPTETREAMRGGPGHVMIRHHFQPADFGAKVRLCSELTIPPGSGIGNHTHNDEDEIYLVRQGTGILNDDGTGREIRAGDAILTGKGASHSVTNTGDIDLIITAVIMQY